MLQFKSQIYYITILRMKELWYRKKYYIYFNILTYKIITHSNNALNDIFEKISKLDIDEETIKNAIEKSIKEPNWNQEKRGA